MVTSLCFLFVGFLCFLLYCIYEHVLKYCVSLSMLISFLCLESYDNCHLQRKKQKNHL